MGNLRSGAAMTTVGVIGLGDIGRGVADAVGRAGLDLAVCDLRAEATAPSRRRPTSPPTRPLPGRAQSDVVVVAVVNDRQVLAVLDGADGALAGHGRGVDGRRPQHGVTGHRRGRGHVGVGPAASTSSTAA